MHSCRHFLIVSGVILLTVALASADPRPFTFVYRPLGMPAGEAEYEQWVTFSTDKETDEAFDELEFRHEVEFGVTDRFQLGLYLADWKYEDGASVGDDGAEFEDFALEGIYNLVNPADAPVGLGVYGETKFGPEKAVIEAKLLVEKQVGDWIFAYNAIAEAEWEGEDYHEDKGEFGNVLGASYAIRPDLRVGAELIHEIEYEDWSEFGDHVLYFGPNASYRSERWWLTVTPTVQLTDVEEEPNVMVRALFGVEL